MKNLVLVVLTMMLVVPAANAAFVVGKVDVKQILESIQEGKAIKDKLQGMLTSKQKILKDEEAKIRKAQEDFEKQSVVMNDKAKDKKEREIQEMMYELQKKSVDAQKELQGSEQQLMKPILEKLNELIIAVSKKAEVDLTVEVRSTPIVYAKTEKDLTEDVIKEYNKKYPQK